MAEAADRVEALRNSLLLNMITAGTAAGFGNGDKALKEIQKLLEDIING